MNEEEKKAIKRQKENIEIVSFNTIGNPNGEMYITIQDLKILLNLIEKQNKVIDLIAFELGEITQSCPADIYETDMNCDNRECNATECLKEYFYKKAEEEDDIK